MQLARFYAMLANGGNFVTPYLVSDVEQPGAKGRSASCSGASLRSRREPRASIPARSRPFVTASTGRRIGRRHVLGRLRELPRPNRGQDGNGREGRPAAGLSERPSGGSVVVVRLGAVGEAGPRRLRADRERRPRLDRGGAGRAQGLRAVLRGQGPARRPRWRPTDGRVRRNARSRPRRAREREAARCASSPPRLGAAGGGARARRHTGCGRPESRASTSRATRTTTSSGRGSRPGVGIVGSGRARPSSRSELARRHWRSIYGLDARR